MRAGLVAREVAPEERVAAWHACRCRGASGTLGQAAAAESWALPRFLVHNTKLWKSFTTVRQYLDTCHQLYDQITREWVVWLLMMPVVDG